MNYMEIMSLKVYKEKSRNSDRLGNVELIVWTEQSNQGDQSDRRDQYDQGKVFVIMYGMSE